MFQVVLQNQFSCSGTGNTQIWEKAIGVVVQNTKKKIKSS